MRFKDVALSREKRFSIGIDLQTGEPYLSIPVSNRLLDYEEYYRIPKDLFDSAKRNISSAFDFAEDCRMRRMDQFLIIPPGKDRGEPS